MIWLITALIPLVALVAFGLWREPVPTLVTLGGLVVITAWVLFLVYGLYSAGLIMNCGGPTFWTADDCS